MLWSSLISASAFPDVEFISSSGANTGDGVSSVTVTAPAGIQDGDLLVAYSILDQDFRTLTLPAGWTQRLRIASAGGATTVVIATKIASSESGNYTFTWNDSEDKTSVILVYRNATDDSRLIGTEGAAVTATGTAPSISPTEEGALLAFFAANGSRTVTTPPAGMVQRALVTSNPSVAIYDITPNGTGATGNKSLVWSSSVATSSIQMQIHKG